MAVTRYGAHFMTDERSRGFGRANIVYFYLDSATPDIDTVAQTNATALEALINGKLVSINKQVFSASHDVLPEGFPGTEASYLVKATLRNAATGKMETVSWVFGKEAATDADVKTALLGMNLKLRSGEAVDEILRVVRTQLAKS